MGESGCGKTTVGKLLVDLYTPTAGEIIYDGRDLAKLKPKERRRYCREIQLIFQDPYCVAQPANDGGRHHLGAHPSQPPAAARQDR